MTPADSGETRGQFATPGNPAGPGEARGSPTSAGDNANKGQRGENVLGARLGPTGPRA